MRAWIACFLVFGGVGSSLRAQEANPWPDLPKFVVIAHRGEHLRHHENTLEAIEGAIAAGADFVELDIRKTSDGQYMLMHDSSVDRMTDGHGKVSEMPWDELRTLRVQDKRLTNVPPSRIPLFSEALKACSGRIRLYLDFKSGDPVKVAALLRAAGMVSNTMVYDSPDHVDGWRKAQPDIGFILGTPDAVRKNPAALKTFVERYRPTALDGEWEEWQPAVLEAAPATGTRVWPDIQSSKESPDYWTKVLSKGLKGAQSDHPAEFIQWLKAKGLRSRSNST